MDVLSPSVLSGRAFPSGAGVLSHLALNSSKDSSWCSDLRRDEVLKVGRATARMGRAAAGRRAAARKKEEVVAEPRAAIRRRDIFEDLLRAFFAQQGERLEGSRSAGGGKRVGWVRQKDTALRVE